jgi:5,5'-dehydrodivanillate O-demethylase oxygenase subunit
MDDPQQTPDKLVLLTQSAPGTLMGRLLRRFWHPVAPADAVKPGMAIKLRILGEDLTLYRGESGAAHLVAARCAHRGTELHTGWVQGEEIRCIYHGWKYDAAGQCTEAPAEGTATAAKIRIAAYPTREYTGLIFAYMGEGAPPVFDLPRKDEYERDDVLIFARVQRWPCNWFQAVENSMDAVHVSFVHHLGGAGPFGQVVTQAIPKLEYAETEAGIRQIATRGPGNIRHSDWSFPNCNHIITPALAPGEPWIHRGIWNVPADDTHMLRFTTYVYRSRGEKKDRETREYWQGYSAYDPSQHHDGLMQRKEFPQEPILQLTQAQDYVALVGQGATADRAHERLGKSDAGIVLLRRIFWRELEALNAGRPTKVWRKLDHAAELPVQGVPA